jgi:hypothetical protein
MDGQPLPPILVAKQHVSGHQRHYPPVEALRRKIEPRVVPESINRMRAAARAGLLQGD